MYKRHANIEKLDDNEIIWRYMDFTAFVSMLDKSALHFSRVDMLDDPFEGSFPRVNVELRAQTFGDKMPKKEIKLLSEFYKEFVKHTFVNCWHINNTQSAAMWKLYLKSNEGIAIRSTFGGLKECLNKSKKYDVYIGKVKYIRYFKDVIPEGTLYPYFHKRRSFEHEKELRAVIQEFYGDTKGDIDWDKFPKKAGLYVPVNLDTLIDRIILAPSCPSWQKSVVKSVLVKYGVNKHVSLSRLYIRDKRVVY